MAQSVLPFVVAGWLMVALMAPADRTSGGLSQDPLQRARLSMVADQIAARGVNDARVLDDMRAVPRHEFVPTNVREDAYVDSPLPIGHGQTISQPYIVALMTELARPSPSDRALEVGTHERYVVQGDLVTFESERKQVKRTISLDDYPALRGFVEAFRAGVTGDAALLKRHYVTALSGHRRQWVLQLRPRDPAGKTMLDSIQFIGSEGRIGSITIRLPDGDRSVMTLSRGHTP